MEGGESDTSRPALQAVSGEDARAKTHFYIIDSVGICESDKTDSRPLERQRTVAFDKLLLGVALGKRDEDTLTTLAGRLARLQRELNHRDTETLRGLAGGKSLSELSANLLKAVDADAIHTRAVGRARPPGAPSDAHLPEPTAEQLEAVRKDFITAACAPFDLPALRDALTKAKQDAEQTIDTVTIDKVVSQGFDPAAKEKALNLLKSFAEYIQQHQAEITALQILYSRPYRQRLTEPMLKELEKKLRDSFGQDPVTRIWHAYEFATPPPHPSAQTTAQPASPPNSGGEAIPSPVPFTGEGQGEGRGVVKKNPVARFADLIPLVRFALEQQPVLKPFADSVHERFNEWLMDKAKGGVNFAGDQLSWLQMIRDHIATSVAIEPEDFDYAPFSQQGGLGRAQQLFGSKLPAILEELNNALVA